MSETNGVTGRVNVSGAAEVECGICGEWTRIYDAECRAFIASNQVQVTMVCPACADPFSPDEVTASALVGDHTEGRP